jgi:alkylation response protein AidB-like acyl-CoA dehydrogenase
MTMRYALDAVQRGLVDEVDMTVASAPAGADARDVLRLLGARSLVAVHYPVELGGRGLRLADHAAIAERIGAHGLADEVHLVTVQGVGCTILTAGDECQRRRWLPGIAAGRTFASLLLSEEEAGTDLTAIATRATVDGNGFALSGAKSWNLHTDWSDLGLCSARTGNGRYDGLSLFIVPLSLPGVSVEPVPRAMGEPYFRVTFDDVRLDQDALVGEVGGAWPTLVQAIGFERAGFDYLSRAQRWLGEARSMARAAELNDAGTGAALLRLERQVAAARALAYKAVALADGLAMDEVASAYSKLACGEAAQAVAWWGADELTAAVADDAVAAERLSAQVAEAPELSISGGAMELQLDLIALEQRALARTTGVALPE